MEKRSEETSGAALPLSRVHRRQICGSKDTASAASDGEVAFENTQQLHTCSYNEDKDSNAQYIDATKLHTCSYNEDKDSNVQCIDATKEDELLPAGNLLVRLQGRFPPTNSDKTFQHADVKDAGMDTIQSPDGHDTPYSEFSQLRLQMKSLMQTQAKITGEEEVDVSDAQSPNINTNPSIEPDLIIAHGDYSDIRGSDRSLQVLNRPFGMDQSYLEPQLKQPVPIQKVVESQSMDRACSLGDAQRADCNNRMMVSETSRYPHEVTVDMKAAEAALQGGPVTPRQASTHPRSLFPAREMAPPKEIILSPTDIPQIVLQQGPTVIFLAKPMCGLVKVDAQSQMSPKETPTTSQSADNSAQQKPPPPYSECVLHMASPSSRELVQHSPKRSRKTMQPTRIPQTLAPLSRANPNLYGQGTRYSPLTDSGTSLLNGDASTSVCTRSKPDGQVSLDVGRTTTSLDNEHQFLAFISCLFCWPIGLVAIYYSNMCQILKSEGNYAQAQVYSRQAFIVSTLAMCAGSLTYIVMLIYRRMY